MLLAILSKTWWRSLVKSDEDRQDEGLSTASSEEELSASELGGSELHDVSPEAPQGAGLDNGAGELSERAESEDGARSERSAEPRSPRQSRPPLSPRREPRPKRKLEEHDELNDSDEDSGEEETFRSEGDGSFHDDDPLAEAYEMQEESEREYEPPRPRRSHAKPVMESPKDFFATELLYRYDILEDADRSSLQGSYRLELKGNKGGIWTLFVQNQIEVVNRREEADVVLSMQQRDFMHIVNGVLNPQLAIVAQKVRVQGDVRRAILFQSLIAPATE